MIETSKRALQALPLLAAASGLLAGSAAPALAQQSQPPKGWFKQCGKQGETDVCYTTNVTTASTGQLVTAISLIEAKGKANQRLFQVVVPTGRMVPPGVGLQVDGGKAQKLDYAVCLQDRCIAQTQLSDQLVATFKKGQELTLTSVNFQNQPNPVKVALDGFTGAYDGPALQQSDIEDRQKKLQDFVAKNNEDFAKKLKEEQDKAKAAN